MKQPFWILLSFMMLITPKSALAVCDVVNANPTTCLCSGTPTPTPAPTPTPFPTPCVSKGYGQPGSICPHPGNTCAPGSPHNPAPVDNCGKPCGYWRPYDNNLNPDGTLACPGTGVDSWCTSNWRLCNP